MTVPSFLSYVVGYMAELNEELYEETLISPSDGHHKHYVELDSGAHNSRRLRLGYYTQSMIWGYCKKFSTDFVTEEQLFLSRLVKRSLVRLVFGWIQRCKSFCERFTYTSTKLGYTNPASWNLAVYTAPLLKSVTQHKSRLQIAEILPLVFP